MYNELTTALNKLNKPMVKVSSKDVFLKDIEENLGLNISNIKDIILSEDKNILTISCAGSGKSTTALLRLGYLIKAGEIINPADVVVMTFLNSGAAELKQQWFQLCDILEIPEIYRYGINFTTIHGVLNQSLMKIGINSKILSENESSALFNKCVAQIYTKFIYPEQLMSIRSMYSFMLNNMYSFEEGFSDFQKYLDDLGFTPINIISAMENHFDDQFMESAAKVERVFNLYYTKKEELGAIDFDDMLLLMYYGLSKNANIRNIVSKAYKYYFVDEFQDTSRLQYAILKHFWNNEDIKLFLIGDDDQSIYSWRGSDVDIITKDVKLDFNTTIYKLNKNYRCRENILKYAANSIVYNKNRYEKLMEAEYKGGEVIVEYSLDNDYARAQAVVDIFDKYDLQGKTGILTRNNRDVGILAFMLVEDGKDYSITSSKMGLRDDRLFVEMTNLYKAITLDSARAQLVIFNKLTPDYYEQQRLSDLFRVMVKTNRKFTDIQREVLGNSLSHLVKYQDYMKNRDFKSACDAYIVDTGKNTHRISKLVAYKQYLMHVDSKFPDEPQMVISEMNGYTGLNSVKVKNNSASIQISTVHEAKGKQWDNVIIFGDVEDRFPSYRATGDEYQLEEERRVHYIAWTRAKEKLIVLTTQGCEGQFLIESMQEEKDVKC